MILLSKGHLSSSMWVHKGVTHSHCRSEVLRNDGACRSGPEKTQVTTGSTKHRHHSRADKHLAERLERPKVGARQLSEGRAFYNQQWNEAPR